MINLLGFDSIAIYVDRFYSDINYALTEFYRLGIKNFLFIFDYDPSADSIAIIKSKMNHFKALHSKLPSLRIHVKCALNLYINQGSAFNSSVNQLYCNKSSNTLLVSLPLFTDTNYEPISHDINHLLYKKSSFLVLTSFDKIIETSSMNFCSKFINNYRIGLALDINYLFNPEKALLFKSILNNNCPIIPTITQDMANYAGALASADFILNMHGKKEYYRLCSQINKASLKIF